VNAKDIEFNNVGYADEALRSCRIFRRLKAEGIIPKSVRLQVSLPTPTAFVTTHIQPAYQAEIEPAYEAALRREVARIAGEVAGSELAIQWDVCHEIVAHDGAMELHFDPKIELIADRLSRLCSYVSEDAELGLHFCYGDPGHKHIVEPKDLGTCVELANDLASRAVRRIDWIHMPVPRDRDDDAFFSPLRNLKISPETELYLGLVHMTDGVEGAKRRIATASKFVDDFGIATECGFGRRAPQTVAPLLKLHGQIAEL
jgi:methionine synthase II (cobalamin-independent)